MASLSVSRGVGTLTSARFYKMTVTVMLGAVFSTVATNWLQDNVDVLDVPFADAVYALVAVFVVRTALGGRTSMLLAAGAGTGAVVAILDEMGVM